MTTRFSYARSLASLKDEDVRLLLSSKSYGLSGYALDCMAWSLHPSRIEDNESESDGSKEACAALLAQRLGRRLSSAFASAVHAYYANDCNILSDKSQKPLVYLLLWGLEQSKMTFWVGNNKPPELVSLDEINEPEAYETTRPLIPKFTRHLQTRAERQSLLCEQAWNDAQREGISLSDKPAVNLAAPELRFITPTLNRLVLSKMVPSFLKKNWGKPIITARPGGASPVLTLSPWVAVEESIGMRPITDLPPLPIDRLTPLPICLTFALTGMLSAVGVATSSWYRVEGSLKDWGDYYNYLAQAMCIEGGADLFIDKKAAECFEKVLETTRRFLCDLDLFMNAHPPTFVINEAMLGKIELGLA